MMIDDVIFVVKALLKGLSGLLALPDALGAMVTCLLRAQLKVVSACAKTPDNSSRLRHLVPS